MSDNCPIQVGVRSESQGHPFIYGRKLTYEALLEMLSPAIKHAMEDIKQLSGSNSRELLPLGIFL